MKTTKYLLFVLACALVPLSQAATITNGTLSVDIENNGQLHVITINGTIVDTSSFFQQYIVGGAAGFSGGSAVNVNGASATYTAIANGLSVNVTSQILGPATGLLASGILQQSLIFTNNTGAGIVLPLLSNSDQDLNNTAAGDTVQYNPTQNVVYAMDSGQLYAVWASSALGGTFGWDVGLLGTESTNFPTANRVGPATGDTAMSIGYNIGTLGAGESASFTFQYLFALDAQGLPTDFAPGEGAIPEPGTLMLLGGGLALVGLLRKRRA